MVLENMQEKCLASHYLSTSSTIQRRKEMERVLRVWKFLLLLFKASGNRNYAIEAITLLAHHHAILPPRLAQQLM